ncbi:hypothetical protein SNE40_022791 [Patella caerulea]|uniref:Thioredoxin domain-containing protein n=1 Tax=Patella caerulea TaxID=87958 RepID=A0AAN8IXZ9_PATCE
MSAIEGLLGATVKNQQGEDVPVASFTGAGKVVGLYFSAHWCPPCRAFTPELCKFYNKMKDAGKEFEIVFISSDRDEPGFKGYFETMPWLALDYSSDDIKSQLGEQFEVSGIPSFILLDGESGKIITKDGRGGVSSDPEGGNFPWNQ